MSLNRLVIKLAVDFKLQLEKLRHGCISDYKLAKLAKQVHESIANFESADNGKDFLMMLKHFPNKPRLGLSVD